MESSVSITQHTSEPVKRRKLSKRIRNEIEFYLFVSPWITMFIALSIIPLLYGLMLSFTNFTGMNMDHLRFVGINNYKRVFTDNDAMYSLGRTFLITAIIVPVTTFIGFMLAILLNQKVKGLGIFRTIFYLPSIMPVVVTGIMWRNIYATNDGILNNLLRSMGLSAVNWLGYDYATLSLFILLAWGSGGGIIIYLAGLKGVPKDLNEAASIDGANVFQRFLRVTLPMMTPILFFNIIMGIIGCLQIFIQPIILSSGTGLLQMPIRPNYTYLIHGFQQIFAFQRYGYGLALLWVLFVIILVFTVLIFSTSRYWVHYEVEQE